MLLGKAFGAPVTIGDLRANPTVRALASFLASRGEAETRAPQADYPLSMTQNGILAESLSHPDSTIYNLPTLFRLPDGIDPDRLKAFIRGRKPPYMVPAAVMRLDAIPLNQNQKVNRRALPRPVLSRGKEEGAAPVTELQKKIAAVFSGALGLDGIGIRDNFFEMGGTSLTVAKIAVRAAAEDLPIAYKDVFDHPTVEEMERYVLSVSRSAPEETREAESAEAEHPSLARNVPGRIPDMRTSDTGDILLTGATGFLGIHVLNTLLTTTDHRIYCLMRDGETAGSRRLRDLLMYYLSDVHEDLFGVRIFPVDGDITDREGVLALERLPFRTVINCAASVKHFAADDVLDRVNRQGVANLVDLCAKTGRRLVHVSTVSVAGESVNLRISPDRKMRENELFFGQTIENKYVLSKFRAEEAILSAVEGRGLNACIVRVGNLMGRRSDGEFQINSYTNAFMRSLRALVAMGKISVSMLDRPTEFSPIDSTAEAVAALARVEDFTVFHATNGHMVQMGDVAEALDRCGIPMEVVTESEFEAAFREAVRDETLSDVVSPLITYQASDRNTTRFDIDYDNSFTTKVLYRLGVKWPIISEDYLDRMLTALMTLGFFDVGEDW